MPREQTANNVVWPFVAMRAGTSGWARPFLHMEDHMTDPKKPEDHDDDAPKLPDVPGTEAPDEDFFEGPLPGMPLRQDPMRVPGPTPPMREKQPLD